MDSANFPIKTLVFTGQNYGVWAVKMVTYLKAFDLWEIVVTQFWTPRAGDGIYLF
jgi:ribonucleotide reductase beta subunit family protein with ferritin-like domain